MQTILLLAGLGFSALAAIAPAPAAAQDDIRPTLLPNRLPAIKRLSIEKRGATSQPAGSDQADCASFVLSKAEVLTYLTRANRVSQQDVHYTLDWSPCHTSGSLTFSNGKKAHWSIQQLRSGSLTPEGGSTIHLYCPRCRSRAYAGDPE